MSLAGLQAEIDKDGQELQGKPKGISLLQLMESIGMRVKSTPSTWVVAEIAQMKMTSHLYIELVEHNDANQEVAKCRAMIWRNKAAALTQRFKDATGGELKPGMKVLLYGKPTFHPQYGMSLEVDNIDPNFTLGDLQKKIMQIRTALIEQGLYERNKALPQPKEFMNVAVIAPSEAAGLGDFVSTVKWLEDYGLCHFEYFHATFQGTNTSASLIQAISQVKVSMWKQSFDAVVVIRGGGALTDLAWLNDLDIAKHLCEMDVPVITGIGHERDRCILDEIACMSFDTPSKVAAYVMDVVTGNARAAQADWDFICHLAELKVARAGQAITQLDESIRNMSLAMISKSESDIALAIQSIQDKANAIVDFTKNQVETTYQQVKDGAVANIEQAENNVRNAMEFVMGVGPGATMNRGFAIARSNGVLVTSAEQAKETAVMEIQFHDGQVKVNTRKED